MIGTTQRTQLQKVKIGTTVQPHICRYITNTNAWIVGKNTKAEVTFSNKRKLFTMKILEFFIVRSLTVLYNMETDTAT